MKMQRKLLSEILTAVKAVVALCACEDEELNAEELRGSISDVISELLFAMAQSLIDEYGRDGAMSILADLHSVDYDEFVKLTLQYREPIVGDEQPADWELPFYGLLMLTEPTNEETSDEGA
jgi:hypothetical protein